jgi:hypothetical protein
MMGICTVCNKSKCGRGKKVFKCFQCCAIQKESVCLKCGIFKKLKKGRNVCPSCLYNESKRERTCKICKKLRFMQGNLCTTCKWRKTRDNQKRNWKICLCGKEFNLSHKQTKKTAWCSPLCYLKANTVKNKDNCWLTKTVDARSGFSSLAYKGKQYRTHRFAYHFLVKPIDSNIWIGHRCSNHNCVNPAHLIAETRQENRSKFKPSVRRLDKTRIGLQLCARTNECIVSKMIELHYLGYTNFEITEIFNHKHETSFTNLNIKKFNKINPPGFIDKKLFNFSDIESNILNEANKELQEAYGQK